MDDAVCSQSWSESPFSTGRTQSLFYPWKLVEIESSTGSQQYIIEEAVIEVMAKVKTSLHDSMFEVGVVVDAAATDVGEHHHHQQQGGLIKTNLDSDWYRTET